MKQNVEYWYIKYNEVILFNINIIIKCVGYI